MADKAKFAFGSLANLQTALDSGAVDAFDLLCLVDDGIARIGWVDKNGEPVLIETAEDSVVAVDTLPDVGEQGKVYIVGNEVYIWDGSQFVKISESTDLSTFEGRVTELEAEMETKVTAESVQTMIEEHIESLNQVVEF